MFGRISRSLKSRLSALGTVSEADLAKSAEVGVAMQGLSQSAAWGHLMDFMERSREGGHQVLENNIRSVSGLSVASFFGTFIRYIAIAMEIRAYNKIRAYVAETIKRGMEAEKELARRRETAA